MIPWILTSILAGGIIDFAMYRHFHFARYYPAAMLLSAFACILLLRAFDDPLKVAKGLLFAESLIYAGICDGISHDIPDWIMVPILAAGVLEFQPASSIEGFFSVSVLFYLFAKITDGSLRDLNLLELLAICINQRKKHINFRRLCVMLFEV